MSKFIEWGRRVFGDGTPEHHVKARVRGNTLEVELEIEKPDGSMVVRYEPGTKIKIRGRDEKYRPFGEEEVILAREIYFFGEGMSVGSTTDDEYFKALGDPIEVTPLEDVFPDFE